MCHASCPLVSDVVRACLLARKSRWRDLDGSIVQTSNVWRCACAAVAHAIERHPELAQGSERALRSLDHLPPPQRDGIACARMNGKSQHRCKPLGSRALQRVLLFIALLPTLVLGPVLGGTRALFHSHGDEGEHVHLVSSLAEHAHAENLEAWHAEQHGESPGHDHEDPLPPSIVIQFPELVAVAHLPGLAAHADASFSSCCTSPAWRQDVLCRLPVAHAPSPPSPPGITRSGIALLLRSSHAILI